MRASRRPGVSSPGGSGIRVSFEALGITKAALRRQCNAGGEGWRFRIRDFTVLSIGWIPAVLRGGSLLFRNVLSQRPTAPNPAEVQHPIRFQNAVCCLHRDMSGSALWNTFRLRICRGYCVHFRCGPLVCSPLFQGLSTLRFARSDLSSRLESATGSGAFPDKTFTCQNIASFRTHHGFIYDLLG